MTIIQGQMINSYTEEGEAITQRFSELFDNSVIPVQFGNRSLIINGTRTFTNPDDCDTWVRFEIQRTAGSADEITRTYSTMRGFISINIFAKVNKGTRTTAQIADMIYPIFNRVSFNGIITEVPQLQDLPPNQGWYQVNVTIPYRWYRCVD